MSGTVDAAQTNKHTLLGFPHWPMTNADGNESGSCIWAQIRKRWSSELEVGSFRGSLFLYVRTEAAALEEWISVLHAISIETLKTRERPLRLLKIQTEVGRKYLDGHWRPLVLGV